MRGLDRLTIAGALWAAIAATGCVSTETSPPARAPAALETAYRNSVAFVRGHIGTSGPYWFLIDTGASRSALDRAVAQSLGLDLLAPSRVEGSAGTVDVETTRLPGLRLGTRVIGEIEPTVYDLSGSFAPEGERIAGIIGYDVLRHFALLIEPGSGRSDLGADPGDFRFEGHAIEVPFGLDNGIPVVEAAINGQAVRLRLDTGASIGPGPTIFVNVTQTFFERLRAADPGLQPYTHFTASGTGGELRLPVVRARSLELGGLMISEPHLIVQPPVGYFARPDAVGFLGAYSLQRLSAFVVDYPRNRLVLYPGVTGPES